MPSRPDPPDDCEEASNYAAGVAVYYFRTGKFFARPHGSDMCPCLMMAISSNQANGATVRLWEKGAQVMIARGTWSV